MSSLDTNQTCAVATGAASGIGRSLALQLADAGHDVVITDINGAGLEETRKAVEAKGVRVLAVQTNMTDFADVEKLAVAAFEWGDKPISMVFANAGIHGLTSGIDPDLDVVAKVIAVNLMGPIHMTKAFMPRLIAQGRPAQLVITGSQASFLAAPGMSPYVATKHALWGYADSVRLELLMAQSEVGISLVAPSRVDSGLTRPQVESYRAKGGDKAADDYVASMVGPDPIAEVIIREAKKREFWIIPSHESTLEMFKTRADAIIAAMPAGEIKV